MEPLVILQATIGFLLAFFVPGFLVVKIFFSELKAIEQVALGIGLSIVITVTVGMTLGYNQRIAAITGGVTEYNVWFYLLVTTAVLGTAVIIKNLIFKNGKRSQEVRSE